MRSSIQEYCKKINRELTFVSICSLFGSLLVMVLLLFIINRQERSNFQEVIYKEGVYENTTEEKNKGKPFGSKSGKTYTFKWCQGSSRISLKNKIYFSSPLEAESTGRTLSRLCQK